MYQFAIDRPSRRDNFQLSTRSIIAWIEHEGKQRPSLTIFFFSFFFGDITNSRTSSDWVELGPYRIMGIEGKICFRNNKWSWRRCAGADYGDTYATDVDNVVWFLSQVRGCQPNLICVILFDADCHLFGVQWRYQYASNGRGKDYRKLAASVSSSVVCIACVQIGTLFVVPSAFLSVPSENGSLEIIVRRYFTICHLSYANRGLGYYLLRSKFPLFQMPQLWNLISLN